MNNPVKYTDPSGHNPECGPDGIWCSDNFEEAYGITFEGAWSLRNREAVKAAVIAVAYKLAQAMGLKNPFMAFTSVYRGGVTFAWVSSYSDYQGEVYTSGAITKSAKRVEVASLSEAGGNRTHQMAFTSARNTIVHELGHAFANRWWKSPEEYDQSGPYGREYSMPEAFLSNEGFYPSPESANRTWRQHPCVPGDCTQNEAFADMFLGWTFDRWATGELGTKRNDYMITNMAEWVPSAARR